MLTNSLLPGPTGSWARSTNKKHAWFSGTIDWWSGAPARCSLAPCTKVLYICEPCTLKKYNTKGLVQSAFAPHTLHALGSTDATAQPDVLSRLRSRLQGPAHIHLRTTWHINAFRGLCAWQAHANKTKTILQNQLR